MSKVISRDQLTAYERWELPNVEAREPPPAAVRNIRREPPAEKPDPPEEPTPAPALPTLEEIEAIQREAQEEGYSAGYQAGYRTGHQEGLAASAAQIAAEAAKVRQILDFLARPLNELDAQVEEELARLAVDIARHLVRRELKTAPGEIVAVVREAVGLLPSAHRRLRVQLHPDDARLVRDALAPRDGDGEAPWRIEEDPALSRGGCVVVSQNSRIDASVEKRLNAVIVNVLGDDRGHDHEPA